MPDRLGGLLLAGYGLAGRVAMPAIPALLRRRAGRGKEDPARLGERYGIASAARPAGALIWVHAASVGETNAVLPLVARLAGMGLPVLLTTVTVTSAAIAARSLPPGAVHQFAPVDVTPWIRRFLAHWRPTLAVFVESEVWPVTTAELAAAAIPHVIVNGRMSSRSFARWQRLGRAAHRVFGPLALALAQTGEDAARLKSLGAGQVEVTGNLKFDVPPPPADPEAIAGLRRELGDRPLLVAASTHEGEEVLVAAAHRAVAAALPDLVTVIAPRHPQRGAAIRDAIAGPQPVTLRSAGEPLPPAGIHVADTLGELGLFYRLAPVAFVGGSLVPHGGQNPIEPVRLSTAVLHGPHVGNFAAIYQALDAGGGAVAVSDAASLAAAATRLLTEPQALRQQIVAAEAALAPFGGALARTLEALRPFLPAGALS